MVLTGRIIKGIGGFYYVVAAGCLYECRARGLFRKQGITPLVGDVVDIDVTDEDKKTAFLVDIHERTSELIRPAVANVDCVLVIFAATHPPINRGLLDRFLINMEYQEVDTVICISKVDLMDRAGLDDIITPYRNAGYRVIELSNKTGQGLDEIRELLRGRMTVLSGPSGVGKSSLINSLAPEVQAETGDISKKLGKGKNTTRHTEIIPLYMSEESAGVCERERKTDTYIIDTPGYTSIELLVKEESDIRYYIKEFEGLNEQCRFGGCVHIAEPGCKVKDSLAGGEISQGRYDSYVEIFNDVKSRRKW